MTAVIYRATVPKGVKLPKVKKKKTREESEEYIRLWKQLAVDLNCKP